MKMLFGSDTARELLHRNIEGDILNRHYTGGIGAVGSCCNPRW